MDYRFLTFALGLGLLHSESILSQDRAEDRARPGRLVGWTSSGNLNLGNLGRGFLKSIPKGWEAEGFVEVSAGTTGWLAINADGSVIGGGVNSRFKKIPHSEKRSISIAAGHTNSLIAYEDGSIVNWGDGKEPENESIPPELKPAIQVASGVHHNAALHKDGTVTIWGHKVSDQLAAAVQSELRDVVEIAAKGHNGMARMSDGSFAGWNCHYADSRGKLWIWWAGSDVFDKNARLIDVLPAPNPARGIHPAFGRFFVSGQNNDIWSWTWKDFTGKADPLVHDFGDWKRARGVVAYRPDPIIEWILASRW